jgi:predicted transcriptional regulator
VERTFQGSLPAFVAAFARREKLSEADAAALQRLIESHGEAKK